MDVVMAFVTCGDVPAFLKTLEQKAREDTRLQGNTPHELPPLPFPVSLEGYKVLTDNSSNNMDELVQVLCEAYRATPRVYLPPNTKVQYSHEVSMSSQQIQHAMPKVKEMGDRLDLQKPRSLRANEPVTADTLC